MATHSSPWGHKSRTWWNYWAWAAWSSSSHVGYTFLEIQRILNSVGRLVEAEDGDRACWKCSLEPYWKYSCSLWNVCQKNREWILGLTKEVGAEPRSSERQVLDWGKKKKAGMLKDPGNNLPESPEQNPLQNACRIPWTEEPGGLQSMGSQSQIWLSHWAHITLKKSISFSGS